MKSIIKSVSVLLVFGILTGCGGAKQPSESAAAEEISEAELQEPEERTSIAIEITPNNWRDYFEITKEPEIRVPEDYELPSGFHEELKDKEFLSAEIYYIMLKKEFRDRVDYDKVSEIRAGGEYLRKIMSASVTNGELTIGDELTIDEVNSHNYYFPDPVPDSMKSQGFYNEDGHPRAKVVFKGNLLITNEQLKSGYRIEEYIVEHTAELYEPENAYISIPSDEYAFGIYVPEYDFTKFDGTLYLYE